MNRGRSIGSKQLHICVLAESRGVETVENITQAVEENIGIKLISCCLVEYTTENKSILAMKFMSGIREEEVKLTIDRLFNIECEMCTDKNWKLKTFGMRYTGFGKLYNDVKRIQYGKRHIYITIPKYSRVIDLLIEDIDNYFLKTYGHLPINQLWAKEFHADGSPHMHGLIELAHPVYIDHKHFFKHAMKSEAVCNISASRNVQACIKYALKDMNMQNLDNYKATGDYVKYIDERKAKLEIKAGGSKKVKGKSRDTVLLKAIKIIEEMKIPIQRVYTMFDDPNDRLVLLKNCRVLENCIKFNANNVTKVKLDVPDEPFDPKLSVLWEWTSSLIYGRLRERESRNLFITGESMIGKSSFIRYLECMFDIYKLDNSAWFNPNYIDGTHQLAVYDEFTPDTDKKITDLNLFVRGTCNDTFEVKHGYIFKTDLRLPCLFISNYPKAHIERKLNSQEGKAFVKRFTWLELGSTPIPLQFRDYYALNHSKAFTQTIGLCPMFYYKYTLNGKCLDYLLFPRKITGEGIIMYVGVSYEMAPERFDFDKHDYIYTFDALQPTVPLKRYYANCGSLLTPEDEEDLQSVANLLETNVLYNATANMEINGETFHEEMLIQVICDNGEYYLDTSNILHEMIWDQIDSVIDEVLGPDESYDEQELEPEPFASYIDYAVMIKSHSATCAICMESDTSVMCILACSHAFHHSCLKQWYETRGILSCPLCKQEYEYGVRYLTLIDESYLIEDCSYENADRSGLFAYTECMNKDENCITCKIHEKAIKNNVFGLCMCNHCSFLCNEGNE